MDLDTSHNFTTALSSDTTLSGLVISPGTLNPAFDSNNTTYTASVANSVSSLTVTPTASDPNATITVNGTPVSSGMASTPVNLAVGNNIITIVVTAQNGNTETYTITVTRASSSSGGGDRSPTQPDYRADVSGSQKLPVTINSSKE